MTVSIEPATASEPFCLDEHRTLECWCSHCNGTRDAVCPECGSDLGPDSPIEDHGFKASSPQERLVKLAEFIRFLMSTKNKELWCACYLIASGDGAADGISMAELAKHAGRSRASISKICVGICARLGIPPSQYMRSEAARIKYRESNVRPNQ